MGRIKMDGIKRRWFIGLLLGIPLWLKGMSEKQKGNLFKGDVRVNGVPVDTLKQIKPGDVIETGSDGEARFSVNKDVFLLRKNSQFKIHASKGKVYELITGAVLSVYDDAKATLKTKTVTAGIRGTGMYVEIMDNAKTTYLCACYGKIGYEFNSENGLKVKEVATVRHDEPLYFKEQGNGTVKWEEAEVINHTDDELREIEAMAGRIPFFDSFEYKMSYGRNNNGGGDGGY